ncbi:MAG: amidohydrolase family protein [Bacteroidales bacterium]|nr:amidohydrolase family protein [Bacteroidales bacterium]
MRFLSADIIFPIHDSPIRDGILVLDDYGKIQDLLSPENIDLEVIPVERFKGFLCPGFVNAHCHLELSWAKEMIEPHGGLDGFVQQLEILRKDVSRDQALLMIETTGKSMLESGIVAVGDISNSDITADFKEKSATLFHTFSEVFASDPVRADLAFEKIKVLNQVFRGLKRNSRSSVTPHATYSVSSDLFQLIMKEGNPSGIFSIHHQESEQENLFFKSGEGPIADRRQLFNPGIRKFEATGKRPLESIAGDLDAQASILLVHNTFSEEQDIDFALKNFVNAAWCLCPNANLYIENRLPLVDLFRRMGCNILLGTDSLASNDSLQMLDEMKTLQEFFPDIPFCEVLSWATMNGAKFFGFDSLGSFEKGKHPGVVLIENVDIIEGTLLKDSSSKLLVMHGYESLH